MTDLIGRRFFEEMDTPSDDSPAFRTLNRIAARCFQTAKRKGWWDKAEAFAISSPKLFEQFRPEIISSKLMLTCSELAEALEELRANGGAGERLYWRSKVTVEHANGSKTDGEAITPHHQPPPEGAKPEGFGIELADAVIRIFDLAAWMGIDIAECIRIKMAYNEGREYRHGGKVL